MAHNFLGCDRDQPFLLPPDLRDWLPQEHLTWLILDVVDRLDLQPFYRQHRAAAADQREVRLFGDARGDELPEALASKGQPADAAASGQGTAGGRGGRMGATLLRRPARSWPPPSPP